MRLSISGVVALISLLLLGCSSQQGDASGRSSASIQSVYTGLSGGDCRKQIDKEDPNETPYLVCPGVAGYTLAVRRVDAGRRSIDVVDPAQRALPLNYQEFVTRHMFTLDPKAEWRVAAKEGKQVPIALIVRVRAHEDNGDPEKVTSTILAVAKITPNEACVTARIVEGTTPDAEVRSAADLAQDRPCASPQPPMTSGGVVIR